MFHFYTFTGYGSATLIENWLMKFFTQNKVDLNLLIKSGFYSRSENVGKKDILLGIFDRLSTKEQRSKMSKKYKKSMNL